MHRERISFPVLSTGDYCIDSICQIMFQFLCRIPVNQRHITGHYPDLIITAFFQHRAESHKRTLIRFPVFDMPCSYLRIIPPVFLPRAISHLRLLDFSLSVVKMSSSQSKVLLYPDSSGCFSLRKVSLRWIRTLSYPILHS